MVLHYDILHGQIEIKWTNETDSFGKIGHYSVTALQSRVNRHRAAVRACLGTLKYRWRKSISIVYYIERLIMK